jgi:hypothetical protein
VEIHGFLYRLRHGENSTRVPRMDIRGRPSVACVKIRPAYLLYGCARVRLGCYSGPVAAGLWVRVHTRKSNARVALRVSYSYMCAYEIGCFTLSLWQYAVRAICMAGGQPSLISTPKAVKRIDLHASGRVHVQHDIATSSSKPCPPNSSGQCPQSASSMRASASAAPSFSCTHLIGCVKGACGSFGLTRIKHDP